MADEPRKRSRFDQGEPEARRVSRFDRRSRSPHDNDTRSHRSRSPLNQHQEQQSSKGQPATDAAAAAAAVAARISAQVQAQVDANKSQKFRPPVGDTADNSSMTPEGTSPNDGAASNEIYQQDGDYIKDIEVNDLRNRYTLTKGATQKMIKEETGADVTTRGSYYPDKSMATAANPPLYLHVTSTSKEGLEMAIAKIEELMKQELPNLVDERRFRRREPEPVERDEMGRRKWPEERIPIDIEQIPGFNLRANVVGFGGQNVKYIQSLTGCRVQIKGRGSGFMERDTSRESDEPMFLHVAGPNPAEVERAKNECISLLDNVRKDYDAFKERSASRGRFNSHDQRNDGPSRGYDDSTTPAAHGSGYSAGGYGQQAEPAAAMTNSVAAPTTADGQDPYAPYGGYQAYLQWYYYYCSLQQQQQQPSDGQLANSAPGAADHQYASAAGQPPPPPPPSSEMGSSSMTGPPPPPPPGAPSGGSTGGYHSVPPPPGL